MKPFYICALSAAALVSLRPSPANAHELPGPSATLVVREGGHVQLRLQLPYSELLRRMWMPADSAHAFLITYASMPPAQFARQLAQAQQAIRRDLRLVVDQRQPYALSRWNWPSAAAVQDAIRKELMARATAPGDHPHPERLTVTADIRVGANPSTVQLQLPASFGPTLLTVYRPQEQLVGEGALSAPVAIGR